MEGIELKISAIETKVGKLLDRQHSLLSKNNSLSQENEDLKALLASMNESQKENDSIDKDLEKITPAGLPSNTLFENEST